MAKCKYILKSENNVFKFNSEKELNDFMLLNKIPGKNAIKFSKDLNKINITWKAIDELSKESIKDDFRDNKQILWAVDFLNTTHDFGEGEQLLSPAFNPENYAENKAKGEGLTGEEFENRKKEVLQELEEKDLRDISELWGRIVKDSILNKKEESYIESGKGLELIESFIELVEKYNKLKYTDSEKKDIISNLQNQVKTLLGFELIPDIKFINKKISNSVAQVKDQLDAISINNNGVANIIKFSVSRKKFANWDSAKKSQFDHRLGLQRQLLEQVVSTKRSTLYLIPFHIPEVNGKLNLLDFTIEFPQQRQTQKWLSPDNTDKSSITYKLKKLIPGRSNNFHIEEEKADKLNKELVTALLGTNYNVSSKAQLQNKDSLIKKITRTKEETKSDKYILKDMITGNKISVSTLEELDKVVDEYLKRYNEDKNSKVFQIRSKIKEALEAGELHVEYGHNTIFGKTLDKYLDGDWELIENDVFLNQDLLVFRNNHYKTVHVVSITSNSLSNVYNLGIGHTLLGKFKSDTEALKDSKIWDADTANVETIRALAVINNSPELFEGYTLGTIKVINYYENEAREPQNIEPLLYNFRRIYSLANAKNELESVDNFGNKKIQLQNWGDFIYQELLDKMSTSSWKPLRDKAKDDFETPPKDKLKWLYALNEKIVELDKTIQENPESKFDYTDQNKLEYLQGLVSQGIKHYLGTEFKNDYEQPRIGARLGDWLDVLRTSISGVNAKYDKNGNKIVGLLGGSLFTTTSSNPSEDISKIFDYISMGHNDVRQLYMPLANMTTKWTDDYYKASGRSGLERLAIGNADPYHSVFFVKNQQTGKIDESFTVLNPYDLKSNLKDHERSYLKKMLWEFFKDNKVVLEEHKSLTVEQAEKLPEFESYLKNKEYFQIPLKKRSDITDYKLLSGNAVRSRMMRVWEGFKDILDNRNLTDIQRKEFKSIEDSVFQMTNEFKISSGTREKMLLEYGVDSFDINLDTLLLEQRFAYIRENVMTKALQTANALAICLKMNAFNSGRKEETMQVFKDFYNQERVSVYGTNIMDKEIKPIVAGIKHVQKLASIMLITLRPLLTAKELLAGTWKNYSYAYTKIWGDESFEMEHMRKAYNKVFFGTMQQSEDFTIVRELNHMYGIANQDINAMTKRTKVDRKGLFKFFSEHMYWFNNVGDFINRMSVFVAMSIKDGSYDAHSIDSNGILKYDPRKDKRFETYFAKREQYKFESAQNDKVYNDQRSLYLAMLADFNIENATFGRKQLNERTDLIPRAYTHNQRESIKVFADTAYGFFDTETKSMIFNTAVGSIFGQFLTFLPSKIEFYFSKEKASKYGTYKQAMGIDEDGVEKPYFLKNTFDEEGNHTGVEKTFEDTGVPYREFMTDPWEGVMYSLGHVFRDIIQGKYGETSEARKRRAMIAMNDIIMGMIAAALVAALLAEVKKEDVNEANTLALKMLYKTTTEFGPMMLFTSTRWEPAFWSVLTNFKNIFTSVFDEKSNTEKMIRNTFKATEILPTITY